MLPWRRGWLCCVRVLGELVQGFLDCCDVMLQVIKLAGELLQRPGHCCV